MFHQYDAHDVEELLTGTNLQLSRLLITKEKLQRELQGLKRLTLHDCCHYTQWVNEKQQCMNNDNDKDKLSFDEKSKSVSHSFNEDGTLSRKQDCVTGNEHSISMPHIIFVIPYKKNDVIKTDKKGRQYTVWQITDLRGSFGTLLLYGTKYGVSYVGMTGELWGIVDPYVMPVNKETLIMFKQSNLSKLRSPLHRVISGDNILRIGVVSGFRLCPALSASGGVCNTPFEIPAHFQNRHISSCSTDCNSRLFCPKHRQETDPSCMSETTRQNLAADGVFYTEIQNNSSGVKIQVVSRTSETNISVKDGNKVRISRKVEPCQSNVHGGSQNKVLTSEEIRQMMRDRVALYRKRVLLPHVTSHCEATEPPQNDTDLSTRKGHNVCKPNQSVLDIDDSVISSQMNLLIVSLQKLNVEYEKYAVQLKENTICFVLAPCQQENIRNITQQLRAFQIASPLSETQRMQSHKLLQLLRTIESITKPKVLQDCSDTKCVSDELQAAIFLVKRRLAAATKGPKVESVVTRKRQYPEAGEKTQKRHKCELEI